eukprot:COSAG01_NODE_8782_length_2661_cov_2.311085_5_plen_111_part_00
MFATLLRRQLAQDPMLAGVVVTSDWPADDKFEEDKCVKIVEASLMGQSLASSGLKIKVSICPMPDWLFRIIMILIVGVVVGVCYFCAVKLGCTKKGKQGSKKEEQGSDSG